MVQPNMTVAQFEKWKDTEAYQDYRAYRGPKTVDKVVRRTKRVLRGTASDSDREKLENYLARATKGPAGERRFGKGGSKVSAKTAALRNWGYDTTGRFR
jgi:hypothetical protein